MLTVGKERDTYWDFTKGILNIERTGTKVRKDIAKWSDLRDSLEYLYDEVFFEKEHEDEWQNVTDKEVIKSILAEYLNVYDENDDKDTWFGKIKQVAGNNGFATDMKAYKANPADYKGSVADVAKILRVLVTGREQTPDLYAIMKILGRDKTLQRLG